MTPHLQGGIKLIVACSVLCLCSFSLWFALVFLSPDDFNNDNANVWSEFDSLDNDNVNNQNGARSDSN